MHKPGHHNHWFRRWWNQWMLWQLRSPWHTVLFCILLGVVCFWQSTKLPGRLRGGLISLPGSESEQVLRSVEKEFSKAIAFPTILVQEGFGTVEELEIRWKSALKATRNVSKVQNVIDMHLGRKIVARLTVNTRSFADAQEIINKMRQHGLPSGFELQPGGLNVSLNGSISAVVETEVRSFKEGELLRKDLEEQLKAMNLPEGSMMEVNVIRHPRRNFAMVEAGVHTYQDAEILTAGLQEAIDPLNLPIGNRVHITGISALFYDLNREAVAALKKAEMVGIPVCFLLLMWIFRSPVAAMLPIVIAFLVLVTSSAIMTKVGKPPHGIEISMFVPSVLSMIGLGVGIDYMLILVARFRECMGKHSTADEAIMEAMHLTATTLLGSGFTVAIGFSALVFTPVMLFRAMGIAGIVVIIMALICIFLLAPPLFKISEKWIFKNKPVEIKTPFWKRWTHFVVERPWICLLSGLAVMFLMGFPSFGIKTTSLNPDALPENLESKIGYSLCKNTFGAGWLMPAVILVEKRPGITEEKFLEWEQGFIRELRNMKTTFDALGASDLFQAKNQGFTIEIPQNFFISQSGKYHLILAMFNGNPMSMDGREWVEEVRKMGQDYWKKEQGFACQTGGVVATTLDIDAAVEKYVKKTALFCMITTFICFAFLYRSFLIPLQAIFMNLLSVFAAYGFLTIWFQSGIGARVLPEQVGISQGINSIVILLLFCALFGLSMDYQVFLISRIAEEWKRSHNHRLAVRHGIELTGRVVTGAAAVMISIFLSFAFVSVLETRQFGMGMAAAIVFDATIIRFLIFPSIMLITGKANWWWPFGHDKARLHDSALIHPPKSPYK